MSGGGGVVNVLYSRQLYFMEAIHSLERSFNTQKVFRVGNTEFKTAH